MNASPDELSSALAEGLAAQVGRWALARGAAPAPARAAADAARALSQATSEGHACLPLSALPGDTAAWRASLCASQLVAQPGAHGDCATLPLVLDAQDRLYLHHHFALERRLARRLVQAQAGPLPPVNEAARGWLRTLFPPDPAGGIDRQQLAAALALRRRLTVVSGGPGTGKTTTVLRLLACLLAQDPDSRIALAAPTGKAAARMAEALRAQAAGLRGTLPAPMLDSLQRLAGQAGTVHRLLGATGEAGVFRHDAARPLALDMLVVDEASMLDLALAARLLDAMPPAARVLLLGDKDQLAAVEAGSVFAELGADPRLSAACRDELAALCGRPAADLPAAATAPAVLSDAAVWFTRSHRFAAGSAIGLLAADIRDGQVDAALARLHNAPAGDGSVRWRRGERASGQAAKVQNQAGRDANGDANGDKYVDENGGARPPDSDTETETGTEIHTDPLAPALAACDAYAATLRAAPGDAAAAHAALARFRVLCAVRAGPRGVEAVNERLAQHLRARLGGGVTGPWFAGRPVMVLRNDPVLRLFNGDIGIALPAEHEPGALQVLFADGARGAGGWRAVPPARLPPHETALALTVHKAQGSEFDELLLLLPSHASRVLTRELLYTAVTRARQRVWLDAPAAVLAAAIATPTRRHTGLLARIAEARLAPGPG